MVRKEFTQLRRDHRTAALLVVMPLFLLLIFGYAARFEVDRARTAVVGADAQATAELLPAVFDVREIDTTGGRAEAVERLRSETIDAAVVTDSRTLLLDGTQLFTAQTVQRAIGATAADGPPQLTPEVLFNPTLDTATMMVPALVGLIMLFIGALATSLGVVRERQTGTLEQLAVMPFSPTDVFIGKLAPYLAIAVIDMLIVIGVGLAAFNVPFNGSVALFTLGAVLFLFVTLSIGVLISTVSENQGQAVQLALMVLLPQVMLSGLIFPLESMATVLQAIAAVLPLTWFNQIARGVMVRGAGLPEMTLPLVVLAGMGAVVFTLAIRRFSRDLAPGAAP